MFTYFASFKNFGVGVVIGQDRMNNLHETSNYFLQIKEARFSLKYI